MILIKYALLLFLLCSVVVPQVNLNKGKGNQPEVAGSSNNNEIDDSLKIEMERIIAENREFLSKKHELHPNGIPRRTSLDELWKHEREITGR